MHQNKGVWQMKDKVVVLAECIAAGWHEVRNWITSSLVMSFILYWLHSDCQPELLVTYIQCHKFWSDHKKQSEQSKDVSIKW